MKEQLDRVAALVRESLGDDLLGLYLFGSAARGELRPTSDLDLIALTRRATYPDERRRLVDGLLELSRRPRHLELTVVAQPDIRPWRYPPTIDLQYGDWLRSELERGEIPPRAPSPDLTVLLAMTLRDATTLLGPPPVEVFDAIPHADVLRAGEEALDVLSRELEGDTRNVLLTLARIWCTAETGEIVAKDTAAEWALARLPEEHGPVLQRARDGYRAGDYGHWEDVDAAACADRLAAGVRGSSRRRGGASPR